MGAKRQTRLEENFIVSDEVEKSGLECCEWCIPLSKLVAFIELRVVLSDRWRLSSQHTWLHLR